MSFFAQNWPFLLFVGAMIYMHFFMHRRHGAHGHHPHHSDNEGDRQADGGAPTGTDPNRTRHHHGGC